jgi:hypothetical protein
MTAAKLAMIDAGRDEHTSPVGEALEKMRAAGLGTDALTVDDLLAHGDDAELHELLTDRANARRVPHVLSEWGYEKVINAAAKDGRWVIDGRRRLVYARRELTQAARLKAARALEGPRQEKLT